MGDRFVQLLDVPAGTPGRAGHLAALSSVRTEAATARLREIAANLHDPDSLTAAKLLGADPELGDPLSIHVPRLQQLAAATDDPRILRELACLRLEKYAVDPATFDRALASPEIESRLWAAIAVAKLGRNLPLWRVIGELANQAPPWMGGNPWTPYLKLSAARPVPEDLRGFLLGLDEAPLGRDQKIAIWALTGAKSAEGYEFPTGVGVDPAPDPVPPLTPEESDRLVELVVDATDRNDLDVLGDLDVGAVSRLPPPLRNDLVTRLVDTCLDQDETWASIHWSNKTMDALGSVRQLDLPLYRIVGRFARADGGMNVGQLGAVLGRTDGDLVVRVVLDVLRTATPTQGDSLARLLEATSQSAVTMDRPYLGAGGDGGGPATGAFAYPVQEPQAAPPLPTSAGPRPVETTYSGWPRIDTDGVYEDGERSVSDDILLEFVTGPDSAADDAEIEQLTQALRAEILQLDDVSTVEQASAGPAPDGTRGLDVAAIGSLVVSAVPGVQAAVKVLTVIRGWLAGRTRSTPALKMTVGGNTIEIIPDDDQQEALVEQFIKSLQAPSASPHPIQEPQAAPQTAPSQGFGNPVPYIPPPYTPLPQSAPSPRRSRWAFRWPGRGGGGGGGRGTGAGSPPLPTGAGPRPVETTYSGWPRIDTEDDVVIAGEPFVVTIGLGSSPDTSLGFTGPVVIMDRLPIEDLEVELVVDPESIEIAGTTRVFPLRIAAWNDRPVHEVTLTALPTPGLSDERQIGLLFRRGGRPLGFAFRRIQVVRNEAARRRASGPTPVEGDLLDLSPLVDDAPPDLLLCLFSGDAPGSYVWGVYPRAGETPDLERAAQVGEGARDFATYTQRAVKSGAFRGAAIFDQLVGYGGFINRAMPDAVTDVVRRVVAASPDNAPSILLLTQEPFVPWELAVLEPRLETSYGGTSPFLAAHTAFSRWPIEAKEPKPTRTRTLTVAKQAAVTANYEGVKRWPPLKHAEAEVAELVSAYGMAQVPASRDQLVSCLKGATAYDLIHVAVHGQQDPQGLEDGLVLLAVGADGNPSPQFLSSIEVSGYRNQATRPFVFLNACQVGGGDSILGSYAGFATSVLRTGASAVVAPLWNVDDKVAAQITKAFYADAFASPPVPVAEIIRRVRARYTEAGVAADPETCTPTLIAYQCFGHPGFTLHR